MISRSIAVLLLLASLSACDRPQPIFGKSAGYVTPDVARKPPFRCLKELWGLTIISTVQAKNPVTGEVFLAKAPHYLCVTQNIAYKYPTGMSYP